MGKHTIRRMNVARGTQYLHDMKNYGYKADDIIKGNARDKKNAG